MKKLIYTTCLFLVSCGGRVENTRLTENVSSELPGFFRLDKETIPPENASKIGTCSTMARVGLVVDVSMELGQRREARVLLRQDGKEEVLTAHELQGRRVFKDGVMTLDHTLIFIGAFERLGRFQVVIEVDGREFAQRDIVLVSDGCHVIQQRLRFDLKSPAPLTLDPAFDYYPLDGGDVLVVARQTGAAQLLSSQEKFTATDIVREVIVEESGPDTASIKWVLERPSKFKRSLGRFHEAGVDRGPLLIPVSKDSGLREVFGI